jgi:hypothetical protein
MADNSTQMREQFIVDVHHDDEMQEYRLSAVSAEQAGRIAIKMARNDGFNPEFAEVWTACGSTMLVTVDA